MGRCQAHLGVPEHRVGWPSCNLYSEDVLALAIALESLLDVWVGPWGMGTLLVLPLIWYSCDARQVFGHPPAKAAGCGLAPLLLQTYALVSPAEELLAINATGMRSR